MHKFILIITKITPHTVTHLRHIISHHVLFIAYLDIFLCGPSSRAAGRSPQTAERYFLFSSPFDGRPTVS